MISSEKTTKAARNGKATERRPGREPERLFSFTADDLEALGELVDDGSTNGVEGCSAGALSAYIHNRGTKHDRAEALAAVLPIARRVLERE